VVVGAAAGATDDVPPLLELPQAAAATATPEMTTANLVALKICPLHVFAQTNRRHVG
jgi:hypothetical protein